MGFNLSPSLMGNGLAVLKSYAVPLIYMPRKYRRGGANPIIGKVCVYVCVRGGGEG